MTFKIILCYRSSPRGSSTGLSDEMSVFKRLNKSLVLAVSARFASTRWLSTRFKFWNGIVTAGMEWMALANSFQPQPTATRQTKALNASVNVV